MSRCHVHAGAFAVTSRRHDVVTAATRRHALALAVATAACVAGDAPGTEAGGSSLGEHGSAIVGGARATAGQWPDAVAVLGARGACTGTLVAPALVLTAGHCAAIEPAWVVADTIDYAKAGGIRVAVAYTEAHPSWQSTYDAAFVALAEPIADVPPRPVGTACTFAGFAAATPVRLVGFGATDVHGRAGNSQLREAVAAVTDPACAGGNGCRAAVAPGGEFVAGGGGAGDSCFGDSGGPVYLDTPRGAVVIGAVSRGVDGAATPCGGGGIYVRTDKIAAWIEHAAGVTIARDDCAVPPGDPAAGATRSGAGGDAHRGSVGCAADGSGAGSSLLVALAALGPLARRRAREIGARARWA